MNNSSFYDNNDYKYPEIAICIEDTDASKDTTKFYIPALTPFLDGSEPYDKRDKDLFLINIQNRIPSSLEISRCTESNYIELEHSYVGQFVKGDKAVISFIGGDINKPYIIGRY